MKFELRPDASASVLRGFLWYNVFRNLKLGWSLERYKGGHFDGKTQ